MPFCSKCGKELQENMKFCPSCGNMIDRTVFPAKPSEPAAERTAVAEERPGKLRQLPLVWKIVIPAAAAVIILFVIGMAVWVNSGNPFSSPKDGAYYLSDEVGGKNFSVHVAFARTMSNSSKNYSRVEVYCRIENITKKNRVLNTSELFSLNNDGVVLTGSCDYDYTTIASYDHVDTIVTFTYPYGVNTGRSKMNLSFEGRTINLGNKPQYGDDWYQLEGVYGYEYAGTTHRVFIESLGGNRYRVLEYFNKSLAVCTATLDGNVLQSDSNKCYWDSENATLTYTFTNSDKVAVFTKENPH